MRWVRGIGYAETSSHTTAPQCRRTGILQDEREPVSAVKEPVLLCQLELECSLKARSHGLLIAKPDCARLIAAGGREAQDLSGNRAALPTKLSV
jgi:hypothetical protein